MSLESLLTIRSVLKEKLAELIREEERAHDSYREYVKENYHDSIPASAFATDERLLELRDRILEAVAAENPVNKALDEFDGVRWSPVPNTQ